MNNLAHKRELLKNRDIFTHKTNDKCNNNTYIPTHCGTKETKNVTHDFKIIMGECKVKRNVNITHCIVTNVEHTINEEVVCNHAPRTKHTTECKNVVHDGTNCDIKICDTKNATCEKTSVLHTNKCNKTQSTSNTPPTNKSCEKNHTQKCKKKKCSSTDSSMSSTPPTNKSCEKTHTQKCKKKKCSSTNSSMSCTPPTNKSCEKNHTQKCKKKKCATTDSSIALNKHVLENSSATNPSYSDKSLYSVHNSCSIDKLNTHKNNHHIM